MTVAASVFASGDAKLISAHLCFHCRDVLFCRVAETVGTFFCLIAIITTVLKIVFRRRCGFPYVVPCHKISRLKVRAATRSLPRPVSTPFSTVRPLRDVDGLLRRPERMKLDLLIRSRLG